MEDKQKLQFIEEIKQLERELYLKKSKLASAEAMEYGTTRPTLVGSGMCVEEWKKAIKELIDLIGMHSKGGNSVEDVQKERDR
jgi:hypothetical protein